MPDLPVSLSSTVPGVVPASDSGRFALVGTSTGPTLDQGAVRVTLRPWGPLYLVELGVVPSASPRKPVVPGGVARDAADDVDSVPIPVFRSALPLDCEPEWPDSPPWQYAEKEVRPNGGTLMAIGSTALAHYSLAITTPSPDEDGRSRIRFEYACRYREQPGFLGETWFRIASEETVAADEREAVESVVAGWSWSARPGSRLTILDDRLQVETSVISQGIPSTVTFGMDLIWSDV